MRFISCRRSRSELVTERETVRIAQVFKEINHLEKKEIGSAVYYPMPLHLLKHYYKFGWKKGDFPNAEEASSKVLSLPVHPHLTKEQLDYIIDAFAL